MARGFIRLALEGKKTALRISQGSESKGWKNGSRGDATEMDKKGSGRGARKRKYKVGWRKIGGQGKWNMEKIDTSRGNKGTVGGKNREAE